MGEVLFYHLTRSPVEAVLGQLLPRALAQGWRVVVRGATDARLDWLDERLWLGGDEDFLPHGRAGGDHDARQPVLLTTGTAPGAQALAVIDGAEVAPHEVEGLERVWVLFDGGDSHAVEGARALYRRFREAGHPPQYWSETSGRWQRTAG
ncbi:DNA polymerase III subunit chi [Rhodobaculum claviforme]|uniref:DNA polymerase III subunit chi n=1 Tax=Rhodobaculum claviforme TaxID=1549854 RepID=A0A934WHM9_9RHOB|nr:DNA polymerase III subunit chi [Rhodobaculum claviforme]MBK5926039.1 DNA polymerase III subunit chi [Rhodobaculum claviforme]